MKLTHQIAHKVQNRIASGKYPCGSRLRSGNSRPISVENTFTLPSLINNIEQVDFQVYSLYDAFRMNHVSITRIDQKLSSSRARQSIARALDTEDGSAIMLIQITAHNQNDRVV